MTDDEKPILIVLPSWNPEEPRFIVRQNQGESDDRTFKNNKCVHNQRLGLTYSVDEIVEVLNANDEREEFEELKEENKKLKERINELEKENRLLKGRIQEYTEQIQEEHK